ncbi:MAG TPA: cytosine permease [Gaiellaceae bacterium]|nr:cytosine permease [Gaiellaceae bacterium]
MEQASRELTEAVQLDEHGINPVRAGDRTSTPWTQFWIWAGANIAPINWILGALGIILGLSLVETILVLVIGNVVGCAFFGLFCVMGHRTGVNQMVLSRAAFGRRGAYLPAVVQLLMTMGWLGVNTWVVLDLVLGIFKHMGYDHPGTGAKYAVGIGIMAVQVVIAIVGFYLIQAFEKYTVPLAAIIVVVMSILAWTKVHVVWNHAGVHGFSNQLTAITQLTTAIGVGWGITWLTWSSDYTRFIKPGTSDKKVFWTTWAAILIPTVWLGFLGASIASGGVQNDPADFVTAAFGSASIPILFLVMHGPVATNILNLYSASLAALSLDIKAARWKVSVLVSIVGTGALIWFIQDAKWANKFDEWLASVVLWISAWAGVMVVDYLIFRRGKIDVDALYASPAQSIYGDVNWAAVIGMIAGVFAGWAWGYGLVGWLQGPIATRTHDVDLSWLTGFGVAAILYYVLRPLLSKTPELRASSTSA